MDGVWGQLNAFRAAVQDGVQEFGTVALNEVRSGVQTIQQQQNGEDDLTAIALGVSGLHEDPSSSGNHLSSDDAAEDSPSGTASGAHVGPAVHGSAQASPNGSAKASAGKGTKATVRATAEAAATPVKTSNTRSPQSTQPFTAQKGSLARVASGADAEPSGAAVRTGEAQQPYDQPSEQARNGPSQHSDDQEAASRADDAPYAFNTRTRTTRTAGASSATVDDGTPQAPSTAAGGALGSGAKHSSSPTLDSAGQPQQQPAASGTGGSAVAGNPQQARTVARGSAASAAGAASNSGGTGTAATSAADSALSGLSKLAASAAATPLPSPAPDGAAAPSSAGGRRESGGGAAAPSSSGPMPDAKAAADGVEDIRKAYAEMKRGYDDMKTLLKKSMDECVRLSEEVVRLEGNVRSAQSQAAEHSAAARAAKKDAADASVALAAAKKEAAAAERAMAKAQAALQAKEQEGAKSPEDTAELEVLRSELQSAVRKAVAAVESKEAAEARAAAADAARYEAEAARNEADRQRREAEAEAQAAMAAAEAERNSRAEAQGMSEVLKAESERRARVFNNAVKAAVSKVQRELEAERDELQGQLRHAHKLIVESKEELRKALAAAAEAAEEAEARTRDAAAAGELAVAAEAAVDRAVARETEATSAAQAAEAARQQVQAELEQVLFDKQESLARVRRLEADLSVAVSDLDRERAANAAAVAELDKEARRQTERAEAASSALAAAEKQLEGQAAAQRDDAEKAAADVATAMKRVEELEAEVNQLRASSKVMSLFQLPSKEDVLAGLGLEMWKDDRLRWKSEDVEQPTATAPRPKALDKDKLGNRKIAGQLSLRAILLIAYLSILHIAVMVSFTRNTPDVTALCTEQMKAMAEHKVLPAL